MKKLGAICLVMAVAASLVSAVPVADNLWDVSGGTTVTAYGTFNNFQSAEAEHLVQWQIAAADTIGNFNLYAAYDGVSNSYGRTFDYFSLFAKNLSIGEFALTYGKGIAATYVSIDGEESFLTQHTFASLTITQELKTVSRQ